MPNNLKPVYDKYNKARNALVKALDMLEQDDSDGVKVLQSLHVSDELAQVFREKPVILIQSMNVKILTIKQIYIALRALDEIDLKLLRDAARQKIEQS